jgi:hypothetical protein
MKSFTQYLTESKKQYDFRIKIAGACDSDTEKSLKTCLEKYSVSSFKKSGTTPIQELPLDFPQVKNCEVNIFEVVLDYPATQFELTEYISQSCKINRSHLAVRKPGEPSEEYQEPAPERKGALLDDAEYKEAGNAKFEDYYGDKYNTTFVKELNDLLKLQRKQRGEEIPTEGAAKFNTDAACGTVSPIQQAADPRKKS